MIAKSAARSRALLPSIGDAKLMTFRAFVEPNGSLVPLTGNAEIPFSVARLFYVYGTEAGTVRGEHAHIECQQLLVCLSGACEVTITDGKKETKVTLDTPHRGLWVPAGLWMRQEYTKPGTVLLVLADQPYREDDYLRSWDAFLAHRGLGKKRA